MTNNNFYCDFNVTGAERKRLVNAISAYTGKDAKYCGAPSFAYEVGDFHIDRNGVVSFAKRDQAEELIEVLAQQGFRSRVSNLACEDAEETEAPAEETVEAPATEGLTVSLPMDRAGTGQLTEAAGGQRLPDPEGAGYGSPDGRNQRGSGQLPVVGSDAES